MAVARACPCRPPAMSRVALVTRGQGEEVGVGREEGVRLVHHAGRLVLGGLRVLLDQPDLAVDVALRLADHQRPEHVDVQASSVASDPLATASSSDDERRRVQLRGQAVGFRRGQRQLERLEVAGHRRAGRRYATVPPVDEPAMLSSATPARRGRRGRRRGGGARCRARRRRLRWSSPRQWSRRSGGGRVGRAGRSVASALARAASGRPSPMPSGGRASERAGPASRRWRGGEPEASRPGAHVASRGEPPRLAPGWPALAPAPGSGKPMLVDAPTGEP